MTNRLTNDEIRAIQARADKATPGPMKWLWRDADEGGDVLCALDMTIEDDDDRNSEAKPLLTPWVDGLSPEDAAFYLSARTDVPALCAAVLEAREVARIFKDRIDSSDFYNDQCPACGQNPCGDGCWMEEEK